MVSRGISSSHLRALYRVWIRLNVDPAQASRSATQSARRVVAVASPSLALSCTNLSRAWKI
eukprot:2887539-Amphidinium_carterae.2